MANQSQLVQDRVSLLSSDPFLLRRYRLRCGLRSRESYFQYERGNQYDPFHRTVSPVVVTSVIVCAYTPVPFCAVGMFYRNVEQTTDDEVRTLLEQAAKRDRMRQSAYQEKRTMPSEAVLSQINRAAVPLAFEPGDYDPLLQWIGSRRLVLIGEASHGTHDFYRERALITRRLIEEKGFTAVAIEGHWPDAYRVHRFVRGTGDDADARAALGDFGRFPAWMWRNTDVLDFIDWLHVFNCGIARRERRVGFYGLDLYSLHGSIRAVLHYQWEYRLDAPMMRDKVSFITKTAAEELYRKHDCAQYSRNSGNQR
jgi:hypothetical protein